MRCTSNSIFSMQKFIHQTTYGHIGEVHTAKPMYSMKDNAAGGQGIYRTVYHPQGESHMADYHVKGDKIYAAADGAQHALYAIKGDQIHTTEHNLHHDANHSHVLDIKSHI